jgi:large subunit ribosomal protein L33
MSQDNLVQLKNRDTKEVYWTRRNKKLTEGKLELNKFSKKLKKVVPFKQTKK